MAIYVTLYKFNKRTNSTKIPTTETSKILQCVLLDNTSVINPVITIEQDATFNAREFNYAYIQALGGRYYFIDDIQTEKNLWILYLSVDVLATYRSSIRNTSQYVVRSSSSKDDNILDTMYITKPKELNTRTAINEYSTGYVARTLGIHTEEPSSGQAFYFNYENRVPINGVCFGIIGRTGVGANYYVCTEDNFIDFMTNVFALVPSDMGSLADGLKKTLLDLQQYIISVVRLPVMPDSSNLGTHRTSVSLGSYSVNCDCYSISPGYHYEEYELVNELTIPQHPDIATHAYYALPPFTSYYLDFLPLGSIPLDAGKLYGYDKIQIKWKIDFVSGLAYFRVGYEPYYNHFITLFTDIAQVGIPIPLSQLKVDNQTAIGLSIANVISDAVTNFTKNSANTTPTPSDTNRTTMNRTTTGGVRVWRATERKTDPSQTPLNKAVGNVFNPNTNVLDQIVDYAGNLLGDVVTKGSTGTYLNIVAGRPQVRAFFIGQAENDNDRFGSPLYQIKQLSTLTGFCVCKNATMTFVSTQYPLTEEVEGIISMLNSGVYLE